MNTKKRKGSKQVSGDQKRVKVVRWWTHRIPRLVTIRYYPRVSQKSLTHSNRHHWYWNYLGIVSVGIGQNRSESVGTGRNISPTHNRWEQTSDLEFQIIYKLLVRQNFWKLMCFFDHNAWQVSTCKVFVFVRARVINVWVNVLFVFISICFLFCFCFWFWFRFWFIFYFAFVARCSHCSHCSHDLGTCECVCVYHECARECFVYFCFCFFVFCILFLCWFLVFIVVYFIFFSFVSLS